MGESKELLAIFRSISIISLRLKCPSFLEMQKSSTWKGNDMMLLKVQRDREKERDVKQVR